MLLAACWRVGLWVYWFVGLLVCCSLFVVCGPLYVVYCLLFVLCGLRYVVSCVWLGAFVR